MAKISNLSSILSKSNKLKTIKESSNSFLKSTKYPGEKSLNLVVKDLFGQLAFTETEINTGKWSVIAICTTLNLHGTKELK